MISNLHIIPVPIRRSAHVTLILTPGHQQSITHRNIARGNFWGLWILEVLSIDFEHIFYAFISIYNKNGFIWGGLNPETSPKFAHAHTLISSHAYPNILIRWSLTSRSFPL